MRVAFYAPMKPPTDPVPSGDRRMARLLIAALRRGGHDVVLASSFRSRDGEGSPARQQRLRGRGVAIAARLAATMRDGTGRPDLWLTYHLYHKAPDWLGPEIADALGIPYVVAEASVAGKRADGAWSIGHERTLAALRRADAVIGLNAADRDGVLPHLADASRYVAMKPFIDTAPFAAAARARRDEAGPPRLVAVGMMRPGDKLVSYGVLGRALTLLRDRPWHLSVVGDGPARPEVAEALDAVGTRVTLLGARPLAELPDLLAAADLFLWPAVNEAWGMALLEAQAAGLPAVVGASGGIPMIVADGVTGRLVPPGDAAAFAAATAALLDDPAGGRRMGEAAARQALAEHDIGAAARTLDAILRSIVGSRA